MTASFMGVRELSLGEIDSVSAGLGGACVRGAIAAGKAVRDAVVGGVIWDKMKAAADTVPDLRTDRDPYTLSKVG